MQECKAALLIKGGHFTISQISEIFCCFVVLEKHVKKEVNISLCILISSELRISTSNPSKYNQSTTTDLLKLSVESSTFSGLQCKNRRVVSKCFYFLLLAYIVEHKLRFFYILKERLSVDQHCPVDIRSRYVKKVLIE